MTLTEKEMFIAKICTLSGAVLGGMISEQEALDRIEKSAKRHGYSLDEAIKLQNEIDDMLEEST